MVLIALITLCHGLVHVSNDALAQVRELIRGIGLGRVYLPENPNYYKSKTDAQESARSVRPTVVSRTPRSSAQLSGLRLYSSCTELIWQRFVASQMLPAIFDPDSLKTPFDILGGRYTFRATGPLQGAEIRLDFARVPTCLWPRRTARTLEDDDCEGKTLLSSRRAGTVGWTRSGRTSIYTEPPPR